MSTQRMIATLLLLAIATAAISALAGCAPKRDYWAGVADGVRQQQP